MSVMDGPVGEALPESTPVFSQSQRHHQKDAPNVVMVVLDDLGFADLGCYGSNIATPSIDRLATHGLRYNNFHVTAVCAPTRGCLITGRNHHAIGMGFLPEAPMALPGYTGRIPRSSGTLPRILRDAGYSTFAVGKWHLTPRFEDSPAGPFDRWPLGMGFERYYGFIRGMTDQWTPDLVCDNGYIEPPEQPSNGYHLTEDLASQAIRFVQDQQHAAPRKPFFLYFATGATHAPHQVPTQWMEPYRGMFDNGWEALRNQTFDRQRKLGVVPQKTTLTPRPKWVASWDSLSSDERRVLARQMEAYAGFLSHADSQIGRLIDFLDTIDVLDNTVVIILSDNGAAGQGGPHGYLSPQIRDIASMLSHIDDFGGFRAFSQYASGWAWAGNTPFRLWKRYTWLGGVRVPMIVHWPISIRQNGQLRSQFCHAVDLMPTILEAADIDAPAMIDGVSQQSLDGKSLVATFNDPECPSPRTTQYFEMMGSRAIYHDGWKATTDHVVPSEKLIEGSRDFETDRWSLFDLDEDFSESHDLSEVHPERLRQLIELWWVEAGRNQVLPLCDKTGVGRHATVTPAAQARGPYIYRPNAGPITTPPLVNGFSLTANVEVPENGDVDGIICAQGDWHAGWALYILDGRLIATFGFSQPKSKLVANELVLAGSHEFGFTYTPDANGRGLADITIDGHRKAAGNVTTDQGVGWFSIIQYGKLLVGRDQGFPVCNDYQSPFPFPGKLERVVLRLPEQSGTMNQEGDHITSLLKYD